MTASAALVGRPFRVNVLHLGKFDGDVGGIERHLRALLGGLPADIDAINLVANDAARHRRAPPVTAI